MNIQLELPWPHTERLTCVRCNGKGVVYAGPTFRSRRSVDIVGGRNATCPECSGNGSIIAPLPLASMVKLPPVRRSAEDR